MRTPVLLVSSALILAGCLTTQENPNYEYSSRYETQGQTQVAQTVPYTAPVSTQVVYDTPTPAQVQTADVIMESSPTGTQYAGDDVTGTPGYMILVEQGNAAPAQTITTGAAQAVDYDYSQNLITADAVMGSPEFAPEIRVLPSVGQNYVVQQGDTIYGLSRKSCVGVDVLRGMNNVGPDYAIKIGQTITLPASRC